LNVRFFLWLSIGLVVGQPGAIGAADNALPVVTKITGSVAIQSYGKATQDVAQTRILHFGDTVVTGLDARAAVSLADVGKITLGPGTVAKTYSNGPKLSLTLITGSLCVQSDAPSVSIGMGAMTLVPTAPSTTFNLARNANNAEIAVYSGNVMASVSGARPTALKAGSAADSIDDETPQPADIAKVQHSFSALHCPDDSVVAQAMPQADPPSGGGHGGGGFLGTLLALGAIAAAVGHGGGGSSAGSQSQPATGFSPTPRPSLTPTPTPSASATPTPTPSPTFTSTPTPSGTLSLSTTALSFSGTGSDPQNFTATDPSTRSFSAAPADPTVATVVEVDADGHSATFSVTPLANGTTSIAVTDGAGGSGSVSVTVASDHLMVRTHTSAPNGMTPPGVLSRAGLIAPTEMNVMAGSAKTALVQEESYTGVLRAQSSNPSVAIVNPSIARGPSYAFVVTGRSQGVSLVTITDDHGNARVVRVSVSESSARRLFSRP
jgi:hypothetical protein